uniref:Glutathione peroxidase n=1 Tax=Gobiocypris rarus TaxID=143606 RepID=A0A8E3XJK8_GOBRA|nr:glutathione peroxidase 3-like, transcript variant [Gobiocypris rarus]
MANQKNPWISALVLVALLQKVSGLSNTQVCNPGVGDTIHNYGAKTINGTQYIPFSNYAGKHVLIVNVATYSGLTFQYVELNALHKEFRDLGFTILGFPCNQFGKQEPGDNHEILPALKYVRPGNGFIPNFPLLEKVDVNGDNEQALFTFLKNACPPVGDSFGNANRLFWEPLKVNDIKWNFEKFLVGPDGRPVMRWFPRVEVSEVRADILKYFHQLVQKAV